MHLSLSVEVPYIRIGQCSGSAVRAATVDHLCRNRLILFSEAMPQGHKIRLSEDDFIKLSATRGRAEVL